MSQYHTQTRHAHAEQFQQSGRAINEKVRLYASVGAALISAREVAVEPYQAIEAILPWTTFIDSVAEAELLAPPAHRAGSVAWSAAAGAGASVPTQSCQAARRWPRSVAVRVLDDGRGGALVF
jgi:hypothetical protein